MEKRVDFSFPFYWTLISLTLTLSRLAAGDAQVVEEKNLPPENRILHSQAIEIAKRLHPEGSVMSSPLEFKSGRWVYQIEIKDPGGFVEDVPVDAITGLPLYSESEEFKSSTAIREMKNGN